ncbi:hypothetical protein PGT21_033162 [Puccinia graminis f. sp. tritici]|uniref:Uncharacterized protein n=1 Tax=Puccinia graminis f. sp. tritici TaxID=56615 RepID=A0A5B0LLT4_PUCGR|nr:hypothetical protein PGTUg99_010151 [Puccinia graminis f. sp. tritici]KAA1094944.1 hypothetical protein PGT21_033162 [Puccinia graminis f. sp. tritici]
MYLMLRVVLLLVTEDCGQGSSGDDSFPLGERAVPAVQKVHLQITPSPSLAQGPSLQGSYASGSRSQLMMVYRKGTVCSPGADRAASVCAALRGFRKPPSISRTSHNSLAFRQAGARSASHKVRPFVSRTPPRRDPAGLLSRLSPDLTKPPGTGGAEHPDAKHLPSSFGGRASREGASRQPSERMTQKASRTPLSTNNSQTRTFNASGLDKKDDHPRTRTWNLLMPTATSRTVVVKRLDHWARQPLLL